MGNIRTITVTTIDGKVHTASGAIDREKAAEQAYDMFHNFKTLNHVVLRTGAGDIAYINPQHIISAVISNTEGNK